MAKMFYTLDETKAELGKSEDQIKQYTRDGRLREFRDGPRLMFRADQVDALKGQGGGLEQVDLGPSDSGAPIGLVDSQSGTGSALSLADSNASAAGSGLAGLSGAGMGSGLGSGLGSGMSGTGSGMMNLKDDTSLSADLGLSGSLGGMPSPARGSGAGSGSGVGSGGGGSSRAGVNVLGEDEAGFDPMAQTAISSAPVADLNLESVGSGSGLLDLTRESDDTSLGAELIDEISTPGTAGRRAAAPPDSGAAIAAVGNSGVGLAAPSGGVVRGTTGVTYVEAPDPMAGALGGAALGAAFVLLLGLFALLSSTFGVNDSLKWFADKTFPITAAIMLAPPAVGFLVGFLLGR
jgi:hypothetical protein